MSESVGISVPGTLYLGAHPSTTSVSVGSNSSLVVTGSGVTLAGAISSGTSPLTCGAITASGSVSCGSNPMTCGALSSASVAVGSGGQIRADTGLASAPAICFGTDSASGIYKASAGNTSISSFGTECMRVGASVGTFVPLSTNGNTFACAAMTSGAITASGAIGCGTNPLTSGAITASGTVSCGTNAMTCGALSCASATSAGDVTQPRYIARVYRNATQSISSNVVSAVAFDTVETAGGGTTNWGSISLPASLLTIPKAGRYSVMAEVSFNTNATGYRSCWFEVNNSGSPGTTRRWGETICATISTAPCNNVSCFEYEFALNDTVQLCCAQDSGSAINIFGSANRYSCMQVVRLFE